MDSPLPVGEVSPEIVISVAPGTARASHSPRALRTWSASALLISAMSAHHRGSGLGGGRIFAYPGPAFEDSTLCAAGIGCAVLGGRGRKFGKTDARCGGTPVRRSLRRRMPAYDGES